MNKGHKIIVFKSGHPLIDDFTISTLAKLNLPMVVTTNAFKLEDEIKDSLQHGIKVHLFVGQKHDIRVDYQFTLSNGTSGSLPIAENDNEEELLEQLSTCLQDPCESIKELTK